MSALTKVFVVLLVILSIVFTAGAVVWVNRSQNFVVTQNALDKKYKAAQAQNSNLTDQIALLQGEKTQIQQALQKQIDAERQANDQLRATVTDRDAQIAQRDANLAQLTVAQKSATDALAVSQKTVDQQTTAIAELRKSELDLQKRTAELSFALTDRTNAFQVADRQYKDAEEQITQLKSDVQKRDQTIQKLGGTSANNPRTINPEPLVRVEGVVRSKQNIGGVPYATISVGAADQVTKGMQFKIIDPQSRDPFLGYLIVDRVEPNEAFGHITGPRVNDVRAGVEVRTQL